MKRLLAAMLALLMCFVMTACGGSDEEKHYMAEDIEIGTPFGDFTAHDLEGNEVTQDIFSEKDVTVVNVWATYCLPCVAEMSMLREWSEEMPDSAQLIGIVYDAKEDDEETIGDAHTVLDSAEAKFTNVLMSDSLLEALGSVESVPTTFIVDREGKTVCTPIVGARVDEYKEAFDGYMDSLDQ